MHFVVHWPFLLFRMLNKFSLDFVVASKTRNIPAFLFFPFTKINSFPRCNFKDKDISSVFQVITQIWVLLLGGLGFAGLLDVWVGGFNG